MILVNGAARSTVSVNDRGLNYGDGLFETFAVRAGVPTLWGRHLRRLREGCARLALTPVDEEVLLAESLSVCSGRERGVLKIILTRGTGGRGYRPPGVGEGGGTTRIVAVHPWPVYPDTWCCDGVRVRLCSTRLGGNPALAGFKHLNRLEQVLARAEWDDPEIAEGLMLDGGGRVIGGTMTNLFMVRGGALFTPDVSRCGIAGVMRSLVFDIAAEMKIPAQTIEMTVGGLREANEIFLCNSVIGIWPVRHLEGVEYTAGALTRTLAHALEESLTRECL